MEALPKGCVLFIEDNPQIGDVIKRLFIKAGYECELVDCANAAFAYLQTHLPDLILLDMVLPDMKAEGIVGRIKAKPRTAWIPIVLLTGFGMIGDDEKMLRAGCVAFMQKPINRTTFIEEIAVFIAER